MSKFVMPLAFVSFIVGWILALIHPPYVDAIAGGITGMYMNLIKFISLPVIFFSITSAITQFECIEKFKRLMRLALRYTLLTTIIASTVAMVLHVVIKPARHVIDQVDANEVTKKSFNYFEYVQTIIPDNLFKMFMDNNILPIVAFAIAMGIATLYIEEKYRKTISHHVQSLFAIFMQFAQFIVNTLPFVIWAFVVNLMQDLHGGLLNSAIPYYLIAIIAANVVQGIIVLPLFLKFHGFSVRETVKGAWPAVMLGFFSKSSNAAISTTIHCLTNNLKVRKDIAGFSIPLCSTINMNACAAFIYITVLFVAQSYGMTFSMTEMVVWIFIATVAAIGNAGVPMGCFFMASAFLAAMDVPTAMMGLILPFYMILDMFETGLNIFSDICVTRVVDLKSEKSTV